MFGKVQRNGKVCFTLSFSLDMLYDLCGQRTTFAKCNRSCDRMLLVTLSFLTTSTRPTPIQTLPAPKSLEGSYDRSGRRRGLEASHWIGVRSAVAGGDTRPCSTCGGVVTCSRVERMRGI